MVLRAHLFPIICHIPHQLFPHASHTELAMATLKGLPSLTTSHSTGPGSDSNHALSRWRVERPEWNPFRAPYRRRAVVGMAGKKGKKGGGSAAGTPARKSSPPSGGGGKSSGGSGVKSAGSKAPAVEKGTAYQNETRKIILSVNRLRKVTLSTPELPKLRCDIGNSRDEKHPSQTRH